MRADTSFVYQHKYGVLNLEVIPSIQYSYPYSYRSLDMDLLDKMGLKVMNICIPDRKAYEIYSVLDNAYRSYDSTEVTAKSSLRTVELPPRQSCRYSAIMNIEPDGTEMTILETSMISGLSRKASISFIPNTPEYMEFMGYMYVNFEYPAMKNDIGAGYFYNHQGEFI
jgi:hypothetical protein